MKPIEARVFVYFWGTLEMRKTEEKNNPSAVSSSRWVNWLVPFWRGTCAVVMFNIFAVSAEVKIWKVFSGPQPGPHFQTTLWPSFRPFPFFPPRPMIPATSAILQVSFLIITFALLPLKRPLFWRKVGEQVWGYIPDAFLLRRHASPSTVFSFSDNGHCRPRNVSSRSIQKNIRSLCILRASLTLKVPFGNFSLNVCTLHLAQKSSCLRSTKVLISFSALFELQAIF